MEEYKLVVTTDGAYVHGSDSMQWTEEKLNLVCRELSSSYWSANKSKSGSEQARKLCDEIYANVYPLIFHKTSEPIKGCIISNSQVERWYSDSREFAAVFAFIGMDHPLLYPITIGKWKIVLLGYISPKFGNKILTEDAKYSSTLVSLMRTGITTNNDFHYVFDSNTLEKYIPIKHVGDTVVEQVDTNNNNAIIPVANELQPEQWHFKFHYYVAGSEKELIRCFPEMMNVTISINEGSLNIASKRLYLYKIILKDSTVNLMDNRTIYQKLSGYGTTLICDSPSVQRYVIMIFLIMSAYHASFYKFFIHCERKLMEMLCEVHKNEHHCSDNKCEIMAHVDIIEKFYETKIGHVKDFIDKTAEMKPQLSLKFQLQRYINDTFCRISEIEEYIKNKSVLENTYL